MAALTDVTLTAGVGTGGTGTVSTLDKFNGTAGSSSTQALTIQGVASGTAVPVSIASVPAHAVTQSGTWTVQPGNTANTTAWKVDGSAVTQPVSIATAPVLVSGTAIIGKVGIDQTTPGTTNLVALTAETTKNIGTVRIGDGTNTATVKAVSTAPVTATDQAIVTVLRPDSAGIISTGTQASPSASYLSTVAAGDIAAAATDSGNPQKIGGVGKTANPTAVTDGQRVNAIFDKLGKQIVVGAIRDLKGMQSTTITSSTSETTIVTAVASTFLDLYGLVITNTSATVTKVTIKDSTSGTTRAVFEVPATETRGFMVSVDSALPQATVNTAWTATCGTSVASVEIAAYYVKNI